MTLSRDMIADELAASVRELKADDIRRGRLTDRALDNQGRPILDHLDYIPLRSKNGTRYLVRVSDAGALEVVEAPV